MAKEYDFKVIDSDTIQAFQEAVKEMLSEGYELHGGMLAFQSTDGVLHYIQAVVKDVRERRSTGFAIGR